MCGIFGIYKQNKGKVTEAELALMSKILEHRGPDDKGFFIDGDVGLGHRRLSILDLSPLGKQPMSFDKEVWITFNGEIYNYIELRDELIKKGYKFHSGTDTEVIINLYKEYGEKSLEKLRGMFAFVIFNQRNRTFFCARDRFGIKPFYYFKNNKKFVFASEIKGILTDKSIKRTPNNKMIYDFLVFNRTDHSNETCFENIYNLKPGHYIILNSDKFEIKQWYEVPTIKQDKLSDSKYINNFREDLIESLRLHLRSDVPVGSALSGGLDSSALVSLMRKELGTKNMIHSFSAVYDSSFEKNEKEYMEAVIEKNNLTAHFTTPTGEELLEKLKLLIYHQEEPFGSSSIFASWKVMELANKHKVKVLLNGQGADEILGYDYMAAFYFSELLKGLEWGRLFKEILTFSKKQKYGVKFTMQLFLFLLTPGMFKNKLIFQKNNWLSKQFFEKYKGKSDFSKNFFNVQTFNDSVRNHLKFKLNHLLRVEDKNSMAFSIESRVPFLDHEFVEKSLKIPSGLKLKNGILKYILREALKTELPKKVYERNNKIGFETPQSKWFKDERFFNYFKEIFQTEKFRKREYFDYEKLDTMLEEHKAGINDWSQQLWKALFLELWFIVFID